MLKNYLKIALRNIQKHKTYSAINIVGLATGMACCLLIFFWVQDELSFDRFHENVDNIYLVLRGDTSGSMAVTSKLLATALKQELPEVINSAYFKQLPPSFKFLIQNGERGFEENICLADSNFFKLFSFKLKQGDPATALSTPNSILITEDKANKYFGEEDAIGKSLDISAFGQKKVVTVSGILENIRLQSHIQSQIILPASWFNSIGINFDQWDDQSFHTYIQLEKQCNPQELSSKIRECEIRHFPNQNTQTLEYSLIPLTKIHLYGSSIKFLGTTGDIKYVRIFTLIAIIILLIASINYMNLSTALSLKRTKEVGIKKAVGAIRNSLMMQFFGESMLLSFIALVFAIFFIWLFLPVFNQLSGKDLVIRYHEPYFICIAFLITIVTGLISGCYPALFLSSFQPIQILKGKLKLGSRNLYTRKGLVVFQFVLSVIIIICTIVVFNQLSFIRNSNLGFNKENIVTIRMIGEANKKYEVLKNELEKNLEIINISRSEPINSIMLTSTTSVNWPGKSPNEEKHFWVLHSDCDFAANYEIEMSCGRYFSHQNPMDKKNAFVINEAAAKVMGLKSPLDEEIEFWGKRGRIIGVTKNFHYASFHSIIEPLIFTIPGERQKDARFGILSIRFKSGTLNNSMALIEKIWNDQMNDIPFDYYFYDEFLNAQYHAEQRMGTIFKYFSFLSIIIACLGLLGLASISAEQRTKEIGIRKVLGATVLDITGILSKEFLIWVFVANIIALPVAYYVVHRWLQSFAYRIDLTIWPFFGAGLLALVIALLTVCWQAVKAAMANPIESLRYE